MCVQAKKSNRVKTPGQSGFGVKFAPQHLTKGRGSKTSHNYITTRKLHTHTLTPTTHHNITLHTGLQPLTPKLTLNYPHTTHTKYIKIN